MIAVLSTWYCKIRLAGFYKAVDCARGGVTAAKNLSLRPLANRGRKPSTAL
jgi:hypothetical protein